MLARLAHANTTTTNNIETLQVAFAKALAPKLEAASGRVLTVLSAGVHGPCTHYLDDPELKSKYSLKNAAYEIPLTCVPLRCVAC